MRFRVWILMMSCLMVTKMVTMTLETYHLIGLPLGAMNPPPVCTADASKVFWQREVRLQVEEFLRNHQDVAVIVDLVMSRPRVSGLRIEWKIDLGRTFATRPAHSCSAAALLNSVVALKGKEFGQRVNEVIAERLRTLTGIQTTYQMALLALMIFPSAARLYM